MFYLNKSIVNNLTTNESSKYSYVSELFALIVVSSIFRGNDFVLCDSPDIQTLNSKIGFEVVQCDLDKDLDRYKIFECLEKGESIEKYKSDYNINYIKESCLFLQKIVLIRHIIIKKYSKTILIKN